MNEWAERMFWPTTEEASRREQERYAQRKQTLIVFNQHGNNNKQIAYVENYYAGSGEVEAIDAEAEEVDE